MPEEISAAESRTNYSPVALVLWVLAISFGLFHYGIIWVNSVDIPFQDEWNELPVRVDWSWIWAQHNEHRIVLTKLITAIFVSLDGWNLAHQQRFNFFLYVGLIAGVLAVLKSSRVSLPPVVYPLVVLWMLSPLPHENHQWAFQNQFHFVPLFLIPAALFLFPIETESHSFRKDILGAFFLLLGILSMSSGLLVAWVLLGLTAFHRLRVQTRPGAMLCLALLCGFVLLTTAVYVLGLSKNQIASGPTGPWTSAFWVHLSTMLGAGWGLALPDKWAWLGGPPFLLAILTPWILCARTAKGFDNLWPVWAAFVAMFMILIMISYGRGSFGPNQALASRYKEYTLILVPLCLPAWFAVWRSSPTWRLWGPRIALCLLGTGWFISLDRFSIYRQTSEIRIANQAQLAACLRSGTNCDLNGVAVYGVAATSLKAAADKKLSFIHSALGQEGKQP